MFRPISRGQDSYLKWPCDSRILLQFQAASLPRERARGAPRNVARADGRGSIVQPSSLAKGAVSRGFKEKDYTLRRSGENKLVRQVCAAGLRKNVGAPRMNPDKMGEHPATRLRSRHRLTPLGRGFPRNVVPPSLPPTLGRRTWLPQPDRRETIDKAGNPERVSVSNPDRDGSPLYVEKRGL